MTHRRLTFAWLLLVLALVRPAARASGAAAAGETLPRPGSVTVEFDRFSARRERTADGDHLSISLLLRATGEASLVCLVFVVARTEDAKAKLWAIWPPQPPGRAITAAGHFHGADPSSGHTLTLTDTWQRLTATIPQASASTPYDTATVYVLTPQGKTLLARPFRL